MILRILCCAVLQFCILGYVFGVMPTITKLNVQCDRTGMKVNVEFDSAFNGIVFSKGHYSDPSCRWVTASSSRRMFNFYIANSKCGTIGTDMARGSTSPQGFKNVIIIQNDPDYQDVWDSARKLSCDWVTRLEKYVTFAPFGVDMLGVKEMRFPGDAVDCWMDIQRGHGPFAPSVGGVVPIGEKLTVVIYVRDTDSSFDVHVKDCYAYDTADYRNPEARAIKLTDEKGCPVKEKLVQGFYRTRDVRTSGATIIAYGVINAFKFPERMDVFLACNVEVCKGSCPENSCQPEVAVAGEGEPGGMMGGSSGGSGGGGSSGTNGGGDMSSTTAAPGETGDGDGDDGDDDKEQEKDKDKEDEGATTSSTTEAPEGDGDDDEKETSSGGGTATEETESSEDTTSEKPKTEEKDEEEDKEEMTSTKDEEEDKETTNDVESKDKEEKEKKDDADEEEKDEEKKDDEMTAKKNGDGDKKEEKKADDEDEEDEEKRKKAARIRLNKKNGRKAAKSSSSSSKSSAVIEPRKRSVKRPSRKNNTTPKPKTASLKKREKELKKGTTKKPKKIKSKKSSDLAAASNNRARIIRAPSSIPAAFSRQVRELNSANSGAALGATLLYQREGRHVRSRRSVALAPEAENATFPAMMHSISIISPVEDFDEQELTAWEKMMTMEGKAEEVDSSKGLSSLLAVARMPLGVNHEAYCFTMTSLLSSCVLLATVVMVLSMSAALTCLHLRTRPEGGGGKEVNF